MFKTHSLITLRPAVIRSPTASLRPLWYFRASDCSHFWVSASFCVLIPVALLVRRNSVSILALAVSSCLSPTFLPLSPSICALCGRSTPCLFAIPVCDGRSKPLFGGTVWVCSHVLRNVIVVRRRGSLFVRLWRTVRTVANLRAALDLFRNLITCVE